MELLLLTLSPFHLVFGLWSFLSSLAMILLMVKETLAELCSFFSGSIMVINGLCEDQCCEVECAQNEGGREREREREN